MSAAGVPGDAALFVGGSVSDVLAGRAAAVPVLGYARNAERADALHRTGAIAVHRVWHAIIAARPDVACASESSPTWLAIPFAVFLVAIIGTMAYASAKGYGDAPLTPGKTKAGSYFIKDDPRPFVPRDNKTGVGWTANLARPAGAAALVVTLLFAPAVVAFVIHG